MSRNFYLSVALIGLIVCAMSCGDDTSSSPAGCWWKSYAVQNRRKPAAVHRWFNSQHNRKRFDRRVAANFPAPTFETTTDIEGHSFIVEASTIEGVNPTSQEGNPLERVVRDTASSHVSMKASRATPKTTIDADFSVLATRGVNSSEYAFHNQKVSKEGELYNVQFWERNDPKRKFYAFFPWALSTTNG